MKHPARVLFTVAAAASLAACATAVVLWDISRAVGFERQFARGGAAWRLVCWDGEIRVDNEPRRQVEARQLERDRERIRQKLDQDVVTARQTIDREPYGSPDYRRAVEQLWRLTAAAEAAAADVGRGRAATPPTEHIVRLGTVLGWTAVLPAAWVAQWAYRRRRKWAGPAVGLTAGLFRGRAALVSVPWLLIGVAIITLWVRSDAGNVRTRDWLVYYARLPADRTTTWVALRSLDGSVTLLWNKHTFDTDALYHQYDSSDPSGPGYIPRADPPAGLSFESKRFPRPPRQRSANRALYWASFWVRRGFGYYTRSGRPPPAVAPQNHYRQAFGTVGVPHWFLLALWAAPLILVLRRRYRTTRRARLRLCTECGYDLRATLDRCPECGALVAPAGMTKGVA